MQPLLAMASTIPHFRAHDERSPAEFSKRLFQVIILKNLIYLSGRLRLGRVGRAEAWSCQGHSQRIKPEICKEWPLGWAGMWFWAVCFCERTNNVPLKKNASGQSDLGKLPLSQEGCRKFRLVEKKRGYLRSAQAWSVGKALYGEIHEHREKGKRKEVFLLNGTQLTRLLDVVCLFVYYLGTLNQAPK